MRCDVVARRKDLQFIEIGQDFASEWLEPGNLFNLVTKELDAVGDLFTSRKNVHHVAAHAKGATVEIDIVTVVLDIG